ncbi:hypothetical protein CO151_10705, partial [bacterium CG_4_9_14_3_um_filter_65_15]
MAEFSRNGCLDHWCTKAMRSKIEPLKNRRSPSDPDAKIAKMKDGRTHLAHKVEHAVDMETTALVAVTLQGADQGDTTTIWNTVATASE